MAAYSWFVPLYVGSNREQRLLDTACSRACRSGLSEHASQDERCRGACAGIRQFHFNAWKDPNGTLAANPAGLKLAGVTNETLDPKYTYFGAPPPASL